ncbi:hypothetical protein CN918_29750 [Priestia megaterium]|nr:hypothetical protein CN918_29750 [Priestia megaterium]
MDILKHLKDFYNDKWNFSGGPHRFRGKWSGSVLEFTKNAIEAFGDYEEVAEIDTDKLEKLAQNETGTITMFWNFYTKEYDVNAEDIQDEELKEYLIDSLVKWANMAIEDVKVVN